MLAMYAKQESAMAAASALNEEDAPDKAIAARVTPAAIPRHYNFVDDMLHRNLAAGRAEKAAYIDPRGSWTYGQLADRVSRFANVLRRLGIAREERILICLTDTI